MRPIPFIRAALLASALAGATVLTTAPVVGAYGVADGPIAQIEFSGNCNNPAVPFCAPEPNGVGLGGIWLWIEIDGGTGAVEGTADVAGSVCGHVRGVGGGAFAIVGEFDWWLTDQAAGPDGEDVTFGGYDGADGWYNVEIDTLGGAVFSFPVTIGHYSSHPAPAVAIEVQVAPSGPTS